MDRRDGVDVTVATTEQEDADFVKRTVTRVRNQEKGQGINFMKKSQLDG